MEKDYDSLSGALEGFYPCEHCKPAFDALLKLVYLDHLTEVYNRRAFEDALAREAAHAAHTHKPFSVAFFDIDNFKKINDTFGHDIGDMVLKELGVLLKSSHRLYDMVARIGGEEFGIIFRDIDATVVPKNLERLRVAVEKDVAVQDSGNRVGVTISIGVATYTEGDTVASILKRAGSAMHAAKKGGKNRIVSIPISP